ncbi:hypothetical protein ACQ86N_12850 [Puia sp. P3]
MKKNLFALSFAVVCILSVKAQKQEIFSPGGKAIDGYDAVAFFASPSQ